MKWDEVYSSVSANAGTKVWVDTTIPEVERFANSLSRNASVLDAGCGEGRQTQVLLASGVQEIVCCDGSSVALLNLLTHIQDGSSKVNIAQCELSDLYFRDSMFDAAISIDALVHNTFENTVKVLNELSRCVRVGGRFLFNLCTSDEPVRKLDGMTEVGELTSTYYSEALDSKFLYEFYDENRLEQLISSSDLQSNDVSVVRSRWLESPHPGFRNYDHEHDGWFVTVHL
ncbi:MAG: class I SAM-dependent methyltransferase [Planctomycetota bacterium]